MRASTVLLALALAGCGGPAVSPEPASGSRTTAPPRPLLVDAGRLMADVEALADDVLAGRAAGSEGAGFAAYHVEERFRALGLEAAFADGYRQPVPIATGGRGVNVVARVLGAVHPDRAVLVTAHTDGLGTRSGRVMNGANDNATGVATLLALGERLRARPPSHTVILAGLEGGEAGFAGAERLAADPPVPLGAVLAVVNLDAVGRGALWAAGTAHYPHLGPPLREAGLGLRFGRDTGAGTDNWTGVSDHAVFHRRGVPFLYLGADDLEDYHEPTDDVARIDRAVFARNADVVVRAVEALDGAHAALAAGR